MDFKIAWDCLPLPLATALFVQALCVSYSLLGGYALMVILPTLWSMLRGTFRTWGYYAIINGTCTKLTWPLLKSVCDAMLRARKNVDAEDGDHMSFTHESKHLWKVNCSLVALNCLGAFLVYMLCWRRLFAPAHAAAAVAAATAAAASSVSNAAATATVVAQASAESAATVVAAAVSAAAETAATAVATAAAAAAAAALTAAANVVAAAAAASTVAVQSHAIPSVSGATSVANGPGSAFGNTTINGSHNTQVYNNNIYGPREYQNSNADILAMAGRLI